MGCAVGRKCAADASRATSAGGGEGGWPGMGHESTTRVLTSLVLFPPMGTRGTP